MAAAAATIFPTRPDPVNRTIRQLDLSARLSLLCPHCFSSNFVVCSTAPRTTAYPSGSRYCGMSSAKSAEDDGASSEGWTSAFEILNEKIRADLDDDWTTCSNSIYEGRDRTHPREVLLLASPDAMRLS